MQKKQVEIVVAHYNEDLSWLLSAIAAECTTIYTKGPEVSPYAAGGAVNLPNIGREGHTYLHHIATHYHDLEEVTLFVQGRINDHVSESIEELVEQASELDATDILTCASRELKLFNAWNGTHCDLHSNAPVSKRQVVKAPCSPGEYFAHFFGHGHLPSSIGFNPAAVFGVPRELIHRHSLSFYQELLQIMFGGPMAHNDPETGHMMEAFWLAMWKPEEYICWTEADISPVERNEKDELAKGRWERGRHCIREEGGIKEVRADSPMSSYGATE